MAKDDKPAKHYKPPKIPTLEEFKKDNPGLPVIEENAKSANWIRDPRVKNRPPIG